MKKGGKMEKTLKIEGMMCEHCVKHVEEALMDIKGVESVIVSLEEGTVIIRTEGEIPEDILAEAIDEAGYSLI